MSEDICMSVGGRKRKSPPEEEEEEEEMVPDSPNTPEDSISSFELGDRSLIDDISTQEFIGILSSKVETDFELKRLAEELFQSLRNAVEDGEQVSTFVAGVKKLFESDVFIQACVETYMEDPHLLFELEPNLNVEGKERMESLKRDTFFQSILQETQATAIIRGVLTVVFGYWSDKDCYNKVSKAITEERQKVYKPSDELPVEMVYDDIPNIDVSPDIEGLKEALAIRYRNDPNHDFKKLCEEVDREKSYFETLLDSVFPGMIPKRIIRVKVVWFGNTLRLSCLDFMVEDVEQ